jgi:hypothetical protein
MLTAVEIRGREIRRKNFAVLAAVAALIPSSGDAEGRACGTLTVGAIADAAKVTRPVASSVSVVGPVGVSLT